LLDNGQKGEKVVRTERKRVWGITGRGKKRAASAIALKTGILPERNLATKRRGDATRGKEKGGKCRVSTGQKRTPRDVGTRKKRSSRR